MSDLKIGSIEISRLAGLDLEQTYEIIGGETILRTINGTGIKQSTWSKLRTTISGGGWLPPGLATLDATTQQTVACFVPRAIPCDVNRQATLPAARRSDTGYTPWAVALMPDGSAQETAVSIQSNVATATAVNGALGYQVNYLPSFTAWVSRPSESGNRGDATYRWEIIAEEV